MCMQGSAGQPDRTSSNELVCSDWVPPSTAAIACKPRNVPAAAAQEQRRIGGDATSGAALQPIAHFADSRALTQAPTLLLASTAQRSGRQQREQQQLQQRPPGNQPQWLCG